MVSSVAIPPTSGEASGAFILRSSLEILKALLGSFYMLLSFVNKRLLFASTGVHFFARVIGLAPCG